MEQAQRRDDTRGNAQAPIDALPVELMRVIFITHYEYTRAPILLLLVCRRWNEIASSIPFLWANIRFVQPWTNVLPIEKTMYMPVTCITWSKLEFTARRAGQATIEIKTDTMPEDPDTHNWLSNYCKSLRVDDANYWSSAFWKTFHSLASLESLSIRIGWIQDSDLELLLLNLEEKSTHLTAFTYLSAFPVPLPRYSLLLGRLRKLVIVDPVYQMSGSEEEDMFRLLINLEDLRWPRVPQGLRHISRQLQSLRIDKAYGLKSYSFPKLSSLTLSSVKASLENLYLPSVKHLEFSGSCGYLATINTPQLDTLALRGWDLSQQSDEDILALSVLHPRSLTIYSPIPEKELMMLLRHSMVEELHCVYRPSWNKTPNVPSPVLLDALMGAGHEQPYCPRLQCFTIMTTHFPGNEIKPLLDTMQLQLREMGVRRTDMQKIEWIWRVRYDDDAGLAGEMASCRFK